MTLKNLFGVWPTYLFQEGDAFKEYINMLEIISFNARVIKDIFSIPVRDLETSCILQTFNDKTLEFYHFLIFLSCLFIWHKVQ